jgi:hypothetical protein
VAGSAGRDATDTAASFDVPPPGAIAPGSTWERELRVRLPAPLIGRATWRLVRRGPGRQWRRGPSPTERRSASSCWPSCSSSTSWPWPGTSPPEARPAPSSRPWALGGSARAVDAGPAAGGVGLTRTGCVPDYLWDSRIVRPAPAAVRISADIATVRDVATASEG